MFQVTWYLMSTLMPLCLIMCILFLIIQTKSFKWYAKVMNDDGILHKKTELLCIYGVYSLGALCSIQCLMCHISHVFPEWYCVYGMPLCVIIYAATKTCLYGFFLERAKCAEANNKMLPRAVTKYVLPCYIACYLLIYIILCPLAFRGTVVDPRESNVPTACLFGQYKQWVFILSAAVDVFNGTFFLALFCYPLYDAIRRKENFEDSPAHRQLRRELIQVVKCNVICSSVCSVSSVTFLFTMTLAKTGNIGHYLWMGGNIDVMVNSLCVFLMISANRRYVHHMWTHHAPCLYRQHLQAHAQHILQLKPEISMQSELPPHAPHTDTRTFDAYAIQRKETPRAPTLAMIVTNVGMPEHAKSTPVSPRQQQHRSQDGLRSQSNSVVALDLALQSSSAQSESSQQAERNTENEIIEAQMHEMVSSRSQTLSVNIGRITRIPSESCNQAEL